MSECKNEMNQDDFEYWYQSLKSDFMQWYAYILEIRLQGVGGYIRRESGE